MKTILSLVLLTTLGFTLVDNVRTHHSDIQPIPISQVKVPEPIKLAAVEPMAVAETASIPAPPEPAPVAAPVASGGSCEQYLIDAGVKDMTNARELIRRENNACDAQRYNMQGSDACGIAQELPCGKSGCGMPPNANGACQVKWMAKYVQERYGSWAGAIAFHNSHNWY